MRSPRKCQIHFSIKWDKYENSYGILQTISKSKWNGMEEKGTNT